MVLPCAYTAALPGTDSADSCLLLLLHPQVPCSFDGGVTARVDEIRTSDGGWVRLVFKTVNGAPLDKVELSKVGVC